MNVTSLLETPNSLPSGLEAMYDHNMKRIQGLSPQESKIAKLALLRVLHSKTNMTVNQIQGALATHYEPGSFEVGKYDEGSIIPGEVIVSVCCGLLHLSDSVELD